MWVITSGRPWNAGPHALTASHAPQIQAARRTPVVRQGSRRASMEGPKVPGEDAASAAKASLSSDGVVHEFKPDWVIAPSETLAEWMHENGMSVRVFAAGAVAPGPRPVTRERAAELVRDVLNRRPLTAEHAACLARGTGVSAEFWLNYEHNYRAGLAAGLIDTSGPLPAVPET